MKRFARRLMQSARLQRLPSESPRQPRIPRFARNDKMSNDYSIIGKPTAMIDAAEKTTGAGKYTDDLSVPGMLIGKILHSPFPHARIKKIDTTRAEQLEGVVAVAIGQDAPKTYGILPVGHDEYPLALDKVRYVGDNVAC